MLEKSCANYEDFAFKFQAHVAQQDAAPADELEKIEKTDAPSVPHSSHTPEMLVTGKKVYNALCMLVQEDGTRIMKNVASQNGLAGWRQPSVRYNPYTKGRTITKLKDILRWEFGAESTEWGSIIEERESFSQGRVPESIKSAVLAERAPKALTEQFAFHADKLDTYKKIKQCAVDCVVSKNTGRVLMDVDPLMKGKGKGIGDEALQSTYVDGYCSTCLKMGSQVERLLENRVSRGNTVNAVEGQGDQPASAEVGNGTASDGAAAGPRGGQNSSYNAESWCTPPSTRQVQALDSSAQTRHGARCFMVAQTAGFSPWKMKDA